MSDYFYSIGMLLEAHADRYYDVGWDWRRGYQLHAVAVLLAREENA